MSIPENIRRSVLTLLAFVVSWSIAYAQGPRGELHIAVRDPQGAAVAASVELVSDSNHLHRTFPVEGSGEYAAKDLPFGVYQLTINARGFTPWTSPVQIHSPVPAHLSAKLKLAPLNTLVEVNDFLTLVDPRQTGAQYSVGRQTLGETLSTQPGRSLSDLVDDLPGWLYEGNGVLHPRGSEYDVQYVVDGLPLTQNRSPAFSPSFDADNVESMRVLTAGYPAEYGRKLGGIVELNTGKDLSPGLHGQIDLSGGSFSTAGGSAAISYTRAGNTFSISGDGFHTDRFLDPPVLENFTNRGNSNGYYASYERDFSASDRLRITVSHAVSRFLVPNYLIQQSAGQRQDIENTETSGQLYFQHTISPDLFLSVSGSVRDSSADLSSNSLSTPVIVSQDRGYREGYVRGDLAGHHGRNDWKIGVDGIFTPVHEALQYTITDLSQFDPGTRPQFSFSDHRWDVEPSAYIQDQLHLGEWNLSAGLRVDHYSLLVHKSAWSPRIGVSRYVPAWKLSIHASYDRVFQTPAIENLLLASSPQVDALNPLVVRLPVQPASANYFEVGITQAIFSHLRLDANVFRRDFRNYSDDDVLLDTGISFPIAFASAHITGEELRVEVPQWGRFSGYVSYANQTGIGHGPVTGGLFLGSDAASNLTDTSKFPISQDQRNTARMQLRFQAPRRIWFAFGSQYGSGLPADIADADRNLLLSQYGATILDRVNLDKGRVRPNLSLNAAAGIEFYHQEQRSTSFQIQTANLNNRVNVINFASLFSGTAVAPPRSVSARLRFSF